MRRRGYFAIDAYSVVNEIKRQEQLCKFKRRWLMRLPSPNLWDSGQRIPSSYKNIVLFCRSFPESLLREDDVLDELKDLPYGAPFAMRWEVKGVQGCIHNNPGRCDLIKQARKTIKELLSELGKGDELQQPVVKAMAVAGLAQKLKPGYQSSSEMEF